MLKIKDSVDLKELEKFGFEYDKRALWYIKDLEFITYWITERTKSIEISVFNDNDIVLDGTLYDLIQAGLVEKI